MYFQLRRKPRPKSNRRFAATWINIPLHTKLGISKSEMNAHLALHARVLDYEEHEKERHPKMESETNDQASLNTQIQSRKLAETEVVGVNEVQHADRHDHYTKTASEGDNTAVQEPNPHKDNKRDRGGHTSGEVWTESPHFLWGP
jgi:hypothetical protein